MKKTVSTFDRLMTAITFAEANEPEAAHSYLAPEGGAQEHAKCADRNAAGTHCVGRRTAKAASH